MAPTQRTQAQLLDVARRFLARYGEDLERIGKGGWDMLRAAAAVFSRVSLAIGRAEVQSYPSTATGPALASATLTFTRQNAGAGAFTLKAGSLVRASGSGALFRVDVDLPFGALEVGPLTVLATAVGYGEEFNAPGAYTSPAGDVMPGAIDTIDMAIQDPPFVERGLRVTNVDAAAGGDLGQIEIHGEDVDLGRIPGEADSHFAARIVSIADAVTPGAIRRHLQRFFATLGYVEGDDWNLRETWEHRFTSFHDAPEVSFPLYPDYDPSLGVYDDPRPGVIHGRWLDGGHLEAAGLLEVRDLDPVYEWGGVYDDPADSDAERVTSLGTRAASVWDVPDITTTRAMVYDGGDLRKDALVALLAKLLEALKAHGVAITIIAQGD